MEEIEELENGKLLFHSYKALKAYCDDVNNPLDKVVLGEEITALNSKDEIGFSIEGLFEDSERTNEQFAGIADWDVSNVKYMGSMFMGAKNFNQPLNNWDVSNVTDMHDMFSDAKNFNQPLNNWEVLNVIDMRNMFLGASAFNQPLNNWDVSSVENMECMFSDAKNFNQPLNTWDVSNVTDMSGMFWGAEDFNQPLNNWDVSNVESMVGIFRGAEKFNQPLSLWGIEDYNALGLSDDHEDKIKKLHNESSEIKSRSDCIYFDGNNRDKVLSKVGTYISEYGVWEVPVSVLTTENKDLIKKTAYRGFDEIEMQKSMSELEVAEYYIKNNEKQKEEKALHR